MFSLDWRVGYVVVSDSEFEVSVHCLSPLLGRVAGNGGVSSTGRKARGSLFHPGITGEEKIRWVNVSASLLMLRHF